MIERALKNQLINAVEDLYIEELEEDYSGFKNRTVVEIIDPLFDNYGVVSN